MTTPPLVWDVILNHRLFGHLDVAGARVGEPTHLTTTELVERVDAERPAVEQALATLRFDDQGVLKSPRIDDDADSEWRIDDRDGADYLASDS